MTRINSKQVLKDMGATRVDAYTLDPADVALVGHDADWPADDDDPCYDKNRLHMLDDQAAIEALGRSMIASGGNIEPISIVFGQHPKTKKVHAKALVGRRRTLAGRWAADELERMGQPRLRLKVQPPESGDEATLFGIVVGENQNRKDDAPSALAKQLERFIRLRGESPASPSKDTMQAAKDIFGVDESTLRNWLVLVSGVLAKPVVEMVDAGALPQNAARELASLPKAEQAEKATKLIAEGGGNLLQKARTEKRKAQGKAAADEHEGLTRGQLLGVFRLVQQDKSDGKEVKLRDDPVLFLAAQLGKVGVERVAGLKHYLDRLKDEQVERDEKRKAKQAKAPQAAE